ncbi:MAG: hypothetical protein K1Y01_21260 [Vicinamibacteria bacterium]|nr:hypothetical protein [Vicinamibacteria bacterium]
MDRDPEEVKVERELKVAVWSRAEKRIVEVPWSELPRVLDFGIVDLLPEHGGMEFDRAAAPGTSPRGLGDGTTYVKVAVGRSFFDSRHPILRMRLLQAAQLVASGRGSYATPQVDQEPNQEATAVTTIAPKKASLGRRLISGLRAITF